MHRCWNLLLSLLASEYRRGPIHRHPVRGTGNRVGRLPVITHKDGEPTTLTEASFQEEHEPIELHAPDD